MLLKKIVFIAVLAATMLLGCKKNAVIEEPKLLPYYMKFKVDGVQKNYTSSDGLSTPVQPYNYLDDGKYYSAFFGQKKYFEDKDSFIIEAADINKLEIGKTYVNYKNAPNSHTYISFLLFGYTDENKVTALDFGDEISKIYGVNSEGYIKITAVTADYVKGTFGTRVYNDDYTKSLKITDGEFCLKRQPK